MTERIFSFVIAAAPAREALPPTHRAQSGALRARRRWLGLDLVAKLRKRQFVPHSLTKLHNMKTYRDMTGATTAVEIGFYKGVTTKRMSQLFEKVISVEIDEALIGNHGAE